MKKPNPWYYLIYMFGIVSGVVLASFSGPSNMSARAWGEEDLGYRIVVENGYEVIQDQGTGCHYLIYRSGGKGDTYSIRGGLTPRLDKDGRIVCTVPGRTAEELLK